MNLLGCLLFRDREQISLRNVVLDPEVSVVEDARIVKRVCLREQVTDQLTVLSLLGRVRQVRDHERPLDSVLPHLPGELILIDEGELGASRVQQYLVHHVVCASTVLDHPIEC